MWLLAHKPIQSLNNPVNHGWTEDLFIQWVETAYPDDVVDLLIDSDGVLSTDELSDYSDDSDNEGTFD